MRLAAVLCAAPTVCAAPDGYFSPPRLGGDAAKRQTSLAGGARLLRTTSEALPTRWDSREHGWITPVRNQNPFGTCWTFAAFATLETQLKKSGRGEWDFSEKNMASLHGFGLDVDTGGNNDMAAAYLLRWGGAAEEANDPYRAGKTAWAENPSAPLDPSIHVQNVVWIPPRTSATDNDALKRAIMEYGAVSSSIYWKYGSPWEAAGGMYYCDVESDVNHAIAIIGWDDVFSAGKFGKRPPGDGAWIVKNSWGVEKGDGGYNYVSYYDVNIAMLEGAVFIPAAEDENYDAAYGYDRLGPIQYITGYSHHAAVFTSAWNEELAAVGVYSQDYGETAYEIEIYTNVVRGASTPVYGGRLAAAKSGTLPNAGFSTIALDSPVALADGTCFAVVARVGGTSSRIFLCASSTIGDIEYSVCDNSRGNTYLGRESQSWFGTKIAWTDAYDIDSDNPCAVCLKAYTRSTRPGAQGPRKTDSGLAMASELKESSPAFSAQFAGTFGAFANLTGANGRTLWESWLAGFDPSDEDGGEFTLSISISDGSPSLSWSPDLGDMRTYTVYGTRSLGDEWFEVDDPGASEARFFKVEIGQ